jgi:hypothetical protein
MSSGFSALKPASNVGIYGRTGASLAISSRSKIGSSRWIYAYAKKYGQGGQYVQYLIKFLISPLVINKILESGGSIF